MCSLIKFMSGALLQESQLVVSPWLRDILSQRQKKLALERNCSVIWFFFWQKHYIHYNFIIFIHYNPEFFYTKPDWCEYNVTRVSENTQFLLWQLCGTKSVRCSHVRTVQVNVFWIHRIEPCIHYANQRAWLADFSQTGSFDALYCSA